MPIPGDDTAVYLNNFSGKYSKPQYYNYDMYEGIEYTLDLRQPFGERVTKLNYHGKAVQAEDVLEIVTNQYRAVGMETIKCSNLKKLFEKFKLI